MADRPESRQPPLPPPPPDAAPPEQRTPDVCRNYVWGTCRKYSQCRFRHELNFDEMKAILKFCHDHQNMETCPRKGCTYLHTSKEEEKLFLENGTIPRDLAERHAAMAAAAAATSSRRGLPAASSGRGFAAPPPPPPTPAPPPPPPTAMPPPPPIAMTPPLTPPTTYAEGYYGPFHNHAFPTLNNAAPPIPGFDASRPPPPFHIADKRKSSSPYEAPARKIAKGPTLGNCHECAHLETRIGVSKQLIQKIINEEADRSLLLKKKLEDYGKRKQLLLALVPPDKAREVDAFIEGTPIVQHQDTHTQWANQQSCTTNRIAGNTSVPHQILVVLGTNTLPGSESQFQNMDEATLIQSLRRSLAQQVAGQEDMSSLLSTVASVITTNTSSTEVVQGVVNYGPRAPLEATNGYAQRPMLPRQYPAFHPSMPPPSAYPSPPAAYTPPHYNHLPPRPDSSMMAALPRSPMEVSHGYPPPAAFTPPPYTNPSYPAVAPPSAPRPAPPLPAAPKNYTNQYTFGVCQNMSSSYHYTTYQ